MITSFYIIRYIANTTTYLPSNITIVVTIVDDILRRKIY
jgi:hypothetical protein